MILYKKAGELHNWLESQRKKGVRTGFVPTMGALHAGHISLIKAAQNDNGITVCSIFVNPTQFNDPEDFKKYPVTIERDMDVLLEAGCDVLFLPELTEIYPDASSQKKHYSLGYLESILEGKFRPGHFQGVCMVVHRLLEIVLPDNLYLGQKDYQQCMVIHKLLELTGLQEKIRLTICPTLREPDGLAMSSRNMRLNETDRKAAAGIFQCLSFIKENITPGSLEPLLQESAALLASMGFKPDYVTIADAEDLSPVIDWDGKRSLQALVAAFLHDVRLIDNMRVS